MDTGRELFRLKFSLNGKNDESISDWYEFPVGSSIMYTEYEITE